MPRVVPNQTDPSCQVQTEADARTGGTYLARAADFHRQSGIDDFTFPALFGRRVKVSPLFSSLVAYRRLGCVRY